MLVAARKDPQMWGARRDEQSCELMSNQLHIKNPSEYRESLVALCIEINALVRSDKIQSADWQQECLYFKNRNTNFDKQEPAAL